MQPERKGRPSKGVQKQDARILEENFDKIAGVVSGLRQRGVNVVIVHSGALYAGRVAVSESPEKYGSKFQEHLRLSNQAQGNKDRGDSFTPGMVLARKKLSEIGQGIVVDSFRRAFEKHKLEVDSSLISDPNHLADEGVEKEFEGKREFHVFQNKHGIIPLINGNDAQYHGYNNDAIALEYAKRIGAQAVALTLADVSGIKSSPEGVSYKVIRGNVPSIEGKAKGAAGGPQEKTILANNYRGLMAISINSLEHLEAVLKGAHGREYGTKICP